MSYTRYIRNRVRETNRAKSGGEIGINGYTYKGGQFLPSTDAPPGTWRVKIKGKTKLYSAKNELVEPGKFEYSPTPFSRSIFSLIRVLVIDDGGRLKLNDRLSPEAIEYYGRNIRPGVHGIVGNQTYDVEELIDLYNKGLRWIDITPRDVEIVAKG